MKWFALVPAAFVIGCGATPSPDPFVSNLPAAADPTPVRPSPRIELPPAPPPRAPEKTAWERGIDLYESVVVGGSHDDFESRLIRTPISQWQRVGRSDFVAGRFSETYRINGDYLTFEVSGGRFVTVSRGK